MEGLGELPDNAIGHIARQVGVPAAEICAYDWSGRQIKRHRVEIRRALGFRECSVAEAKNLTDWLACHVARSERRPDRVRDELLLHCRAQRIEPPESTRIERIVRSALHQAEETLFAQIVSRLGADAVVRLEVLVAVGEGELGGEDARGVLGMIQTDTGRVSLATMLDEINKLQAARAIGLPPGLFADVAPRWSLRGGPER